MTQKSVPVYTPSELECLSVNNHACLRFHYNLDNDIELPTAGELFTALTLEQAKDLVAFLQQYISKAEIAESLSSKSRH
ncbi:hypothetical protein [Citrobacter sp. TSA-1]|uniref:hypothetical protein n=1 Tax=Citrobacter sp. TSA-1 TaxID=184912 RepID=UPI001140A2D1|nr:hypothetical protein [Citrobacter sp. TSA-1]QKE19522.1 hypothetical protein HF677_007505 [Citrobacter sp. TSA-1]